MSSNQVVEKNAGRGMSDKQKKMISCQSNYKIFESAKPFTQLEQEIAELGKQYQQLAKQKLNQEQNSLNSRLKEGIQLLEAIAGSINALAADLEAEIVKFKEVAVEVNKDYHLLQQPRHYKETSLDEAKKHKCKTLNIWEVHNPAVPSIVRRGAKFILTTKTVNLFNSEQEVYTAMRAEAAQKRREALENWLTEQHKSVI
ncbi:MAG: hypothetical protein KME64_13645 [Scytonematopsis contorta HA4267-MV1]|jgi:DNA repair exonuclease SbcCD ATPase subunit|nr:hypothetical protein [Scytonematopsis contorta HA4267-MV1]